MGKGSVRKKQKGRDGGRRELSYSRPLNCQGGGKFLNNNFIVPGLQ